MKKLIMGFTLMPFMALATALSDGLLAICDHALSAAEVQTSCDKGVPLEYAWRDIAGWYSEWWGVGGNTNANITIENHCLHFDSGARALLSISGSGELTFKGRGSYDGFFYTCDGKAGTVGSHIRNSDEFATYTLEVADGGCHTILWATYDAGYLIDHAWGEICDVRWNGIPIPYPADNSLVAHYKFDGNADDSSGNKNDGVVYGATLTADRFGNVNSAYAFDGDDWISVQNSESLNSTVGSNSIAFWCKADGWDNRLIPVLDKKGLLCCLFGNKDAAHTVHDIYIGAGDSVDDFDMGRDVPLNAWHHWAIVQSGYNITIYLDGQKLITHDKCSSLTDTAGPLYIGTTWHTMMGSLADRTYLNGALDDIRIYKRVLSADDVKKLYEDESQIVIPTYTVLAGVKNDLDVGLKGYKSTVLPKGLSYNAKTGKITGATKAIGEYEVTFSKAGEKDVVVKLVVREEKTPAIECPILDAGEFMAGVLGAENGIPIGLDAESGVKSVTQKGLPAGMKLVQDKTTKVWSIEGAATKPGTYAVSLTLTTVAGTKVEKKFDVTVASLPAMTVGTFNGFVNRRNDSYPADAGDVFGALQVTTTDAGKITAKITAAAKTYSFSSTSWNRITDDGYEAEISLKSGESLTLVVNPFAAWNDRQLTGRFFFKSMPTDGTYYEAVAQRNAYGKLWHFVAEGNETDGWTLSYVDNAKAANLTVSLNADGKTSVVGSLVGSYTTFRVSASGYCDVSEISNGATIADFAPIVTVNKEKRILSIKTNLWFDRTNDHEMIGAARLSW